MTTETYWVFSTYGTETADPKTAADNGIVEHTDLDSAIAEAKDGYKGWDIEEDGPMTTHVYRCDGAEFEEADTVTTWISTWNSEVDG